MQYPDIYIPTTPELIEKAMELYPQMVPVICASRDKFIADESMKRHINKQFDADICEMAAKMCLEIVEQVLNG